MPCYSWSCLFQLLCSWPKTELQVPTSDCINYNETIIIMVFIKHYIFKMRLSINLVFEIGAKENIFRMIHNHAFSQGGWRLWPHFSQTFSDKNEEFLCSSERKFPEFCKTHPTFVSRPLLVASMAHQTLSSVFFGTPCTSMR